MYLGKFTSYLYWPKALNLEKLGRKTGYQKMSWNTNFFPYSKPLQYYSQPKFCIEDKVRISTYDLPFKMSYKPQFTGEVFKIVAISSGKPTTNTKKSEQDEITRGKFYQKDLIEIS